MMRSRELRSVVYTTGVALAVLLLVPAGARWTALGAQNTPPQADQPIRVQVNLVNLFATVRDKHTKQIVSTLEQNDFTVAEDGVDQKISLFSRDIEASRDPGSADRHQRQQKGFGCRAGGCVAISLTRVMRKGDLTSIISFDSMRTSWPTSPRMSVGWGAPSVARALTCRADKVLFRSNLPEPFFTMRCTSPAMTSWPAKPGEKPSSSLPMPMTRAVVSACRKPSK